MAKERTITIEFSEAEVALLIEALDSHEYWQLSEPHERTTGTRRFRTARTTKWTPSGG